MSSPPTSSPFTYSCGYVGQLEKVFSPCRTYETAGTLTPAPQRKGQRDQGHKGQNLLPHPPECRRSRIQHCKRRTFNRQFSSKQEFVNLLCVFKIVKKINHFGANKIYCRKTEIILLLHPSGTIQNKSCQDTNMSEFFSRFTQGPADFS